MKSNFVIILTILTGCFSAFGGESLEAGIYSSNISDPSFPKTCITEVNEERIIHLGVGRGKKGQLVCDLLSTTSYYKAPTSAVYVNHYSPKKRYNKDGQFRDIVYEAGDMLHYRFSIAILSNDEFVESISILHYRKNELLKEYLYEAPYQRKGPINYDRYKLVR